MTNIPSKKIIVAQILLIFVIPVVLIYFHILPINSRIFLLTVAALCIYGIIRHEQWAYEEMGLHENIRTAIPYYAVFTVLGVITLIAISSRTQLPDTDTHIFFLKTFALFLPISFFQEFAFRAFLIPRLKLLTRNIGVIIFINALLFSIIHIIYANISIGIPLTFIGGLFFAWIYIKYPSLLLVFLSHAVLNITAVLLGFFNVT